MRKTVGWFCLLLGAASALAAPQYPQFAERSVESLDGLWAFQWVGEDANLDSFVPPKAVGGGLAAVPGVFDTEVACYGRRGTALYRRTVKARKGKLRLTFFGLGLYGKIWWDGQVIGEYRLPWSTVAFDFENGTDGRHTLDVLVDNRENEAHSPLFRNSFDFYPWGGIYRSVRLERLPEARIERVAVKTLDVARGLVRLDVESVGTIGRRASVSFDSGDAFELALTGAVTRAECALADKRAWSPTSPALHTVRVAIAGDSILDRFGLRKIETRGREILLNGSPIRLFGVNRHEAHPELGPVQDDHLMLEDLKLVRAMNGNFIRAVHYQHDPRFYELCDEFGMLAWTESLGWGLSANYLLRHRAEVEAETCILARLAANHPAVIFVGFLNECESSAAGAVPLYRELAERVRAEAPNALVTWASNRLEKDKCFGAADVVSLNYYPVWIGTPRPAGNPTTGVAEYIQTLAKHFSDPAWKEVCDKPLLTSETGCCGAYGVHDLAAAQWSEEFEAAYDVASIRASMGNGRFVGVTVWQMFDCRSYVNFGDIRSKFRGYNVAGLLDEYRRPKLAYRAVGEAYRDLQK